MFFQSHISGIAAWLMWNKKEVHQLDIGCSMWPWPLTSLMTLALDFSRSTFEIAVSGNCLSDWCEKRKLIRYWADCMTFALWPHSRPWPWSFKVKVWNSLISGVGRLIDMKQKGCESSIHDHDIDLWPWWGGWMCRIVIGGDFRHQCAVDISSWMWNVQFT